MTVFLVWVEWDDMSGRLSLDDVYATRAAADRAADVLRASKGPLDYVDVLVQDCEAKE